MRYTVAVLDHPFADLEIERRVLHEIGAQVVDVQARTESEAQRACQLADAVLVRRYPLGRPVIAAMERCRIICSYGAGYDNVDIAAASERGIKVANTTGYGDEEVAEHALALLLALARRLLPQRTALADDAGAGRPVGWSHMQFVPIRRLREQALGIIGLGRIGRTLARKATGIGIGVLAADPAVPPAQAAELGVRLVPLDELLREADFVSLHVPLVPQTRQLVGEAELAAMKPTAYLLNCARGPVVDQRALLQALQAGRLAGAGLDVLDPEPPAPETLRALLALPNVIVTPHVAWYSEESVVDRRRMAAETVKQALVSSAPGAPP